MFEEVVGKEDMVNVAGAGSGLKGGRECVEVRQVMRDGRVEFVGRLEVMEYIVLNGGSGMDVDIHVAEGNEVNMVICFFNG